MPHFDTREMFINSRLLLALFTMVLIAALLINKPLFLLLNEWATFRPLFWLHLTHLGDILVAVSLFGVFIDKQSKLLWSLAISMAESQIKIPRDCGLLHMFDKGQKRH